MSDKHTNTCEQNARHERFVAEPTSAAYPLVLRRGLQGSWIRAVLKMASQRMARRTMALAVLLVLGMAASESRAQPPFGGPPPMGGMMGPPRFGPGMGMPPFGGPPPMGGPPMGGMMGAPRFGPGMGMPSFGGPPPMGGPPMGGMMGAPRFGPGMGMGIGGRPGPGPIPRSAGMAPGRPIPGRPVPGGAGGGLADRGRVGAGGRPEPGRAYNPHHASLYRGGWVNSRGGTSINSRNASWYHDGWANSRGGTPDKRRDSAAWDKARDYVREERARDYAAGLAWGLGGGASSDYGSGSGSGSGSGYDSGYGYDSGSGTGTGYDSGYGAGTGTGSGDAYANTSSDASSTDSDSSRTDAAQETKSDSQQDAAAEERGYQAFDRARDAFKAGDYAAALELIDEAFKDVPSDPLVHEFKALVLFARGEDPRAAAELHDVLAVRPGMDWTTLSGLYPDVATYTGHLRALEDRCRHDLNAAAPRFVLAYHYLAAGHQDAGVAQLKVLITLEPSDRVARRLLASLTGTPSAPPEPTTTRAVPERDGAAGRPRSVDLVGRWRGDRDGSTFELSLDGRGRFVWQAAREGKAIATVTGAYALSRDTLTLNAEDRPPLRTSMTESSRDSFRLKTVGDIPGDPGLGFRRVAVPAEPDRDQRGGPRENR